jgi:menaquinone-dependent protoporphyrinogen oxidase
VRILVAAASRYGATAEIADAIAATLEAAGHETTRCPIEEAGPPDHHDAVVLGSAIYMGQWLKPARWYVSGHAEALRTRPVWLFSSGPLGDPPTPDPDALDISALTDLIDPVDHRVFGGRLERDRLNLRDRAVVTALRAPERDDRPWPAIVAWASDIDRMLTGDRVGGDRR